MLNITASSGEFYQGDCESLILPTGDGVYGVQAGHNPVLVALHMGIAKFTVNGETREVLIAAIDAALVKIQDDGRLAAMQEKWFGVTTALPKEMPAM